MSDGRASGLVSVMIPAYNAERYLAEAIESVLAQAYRPLEVIVVDDGSDDRTAEIARAYGGELRLVRQGRKGNAAARNAGARRARGAYLAFLDADDRFVPGRLERQVQALAEAPEVEIVYGQVREFLTPELDEATRSRLRPPAGDTACSLPAAMLARREAFERVGPFDESLTVGVTVDWSMRARDMGVTGRVLPAVVLERRLHGGNNGIREAALRSAYARVVKASLDRRRRERV